MPRYLVYPSLIDSQKQAYKYAIFEGGHFKRWEALDIPRIICIEEFHAELDDVLDVVPEEPIEPQAPGQKAKRDIINRIRRTLSETLECK